MGSGWRLVREVQEFKVEKSGDRAFSCWRQRRDHTIFLTSLTILGSNTAVSISPLSS